MTAIDGLTKIKTMFGATLTFPDLIPVEENYYPYQFVEKFKLSDIAIESDLQTKERWEKGSDESFLSTLFYNTYTGIIIICDIDSCLEKAIKDNNKNDIKYFISLKNMGKKYISCDGNHRSQVIWSFNINNDITIFKHRNIKVVILKYISREELHNYTVKSNEQKSWNRQESRNAIISPVNDLVRTLTFDYNEIITLLSLESNRYKDREFFTSLLFILDNRYKNIPKGFNQKALDNLLTSNLSPLVYNNINQIMCLWKTMIKLYNKKTNKKIHKMFWVLLYLICDEVLSNSIEDLDEKYIEYVVNNFIEITNEIYTNETLVGKGGLFSLSCRMSFSNINSRLEYFTNKIYINEK